MAPAPAVGADSVEAFLVKCAEALGSDATRDALRSCTSKRPGQMIVEVQKQVWDDMGVPVDAGRQAVSSFEQLFPERREQLAALRDAFAAAVDAAYLRCLEDRRPEALEASAKMPRGVVLEFLDACGVVLDTTEARERLREQISATGAMPEGVVNDIHGEVMELLGFERAHGQRCFAEMGADPELARDRELAMRVARWRGKNSSACLALLHEFRKGGGELNVDEEVSAKLLELQAKDGLDTMPLEERSALLEKHAKRVNIFRALPADGRKRYLDKLSEQEKLELAQCEILIVTLAQNSERLKREAARKAE